MVLWKWRLLWAAILIAGGIVMFAGQLLTVVVLSGYSATVRSESIGGCVQPGTQKPVSVTEGSKDRAEQVSNAKIIDQAAQKAGLSGYASRIAIIAAMGESTLINIDYGDQVNGVTNQDGSPATSFGLFQQQTSQGWGTKEEVMNPEHAATSFFLGPKHDGKSGLVAVPNWENETWISNVIHTVQRNSDADHYTKVIPEADAIISEAGINIHRAASPTAAPGGTATVSDPGKKGCGGAEGGVTVGDMTGKWVAPLPGSILTSGYGPRATPAGTADFGAFHYGLDFSTPGEGGPVLAATDMKISIATDHGNVTAGTYVKGQSTDGTVTLSYAHMVTGSLKVKAGDTVAAGTVLGTEGETGNVQGRHLHFEIYKGAIPDPWAQTAPVTDPCPILTAKIPGFSCEQGSKSGAVTAMGTRADNSNVYALANWSPATGQRTMCVPAGCSCGCGRGPRYSRMAA